MVRGSGASTEVSPTMPKFTYWESLTPEPLLHQLSPESHWHQVLMIQLMFRAVEPRIPHTIRTLSSRPTIILLLSHIQFYYQELHLMVLPTNVHLLWTLQQQHLLLINHQQFYHHYNHYHQLHIVFLLLFF